MSETIKKRKWDQADQSQDDAAASPSAKQTKLDESADPSKAVSEAAARINAMLAQKGISIEDEKEPSKAPEAGEFVKDIPINELKNRYMLTRGATQAQIQRETGADVTTRGKYYPDMQLASDKEPPLYLHVSAKDQESLDKAIQQIEELIETSQVPLPGTGYPPRDNNNDMKQQQHQRPERKFHEKKLPVDIPGNPPFNLRAKIVGPHGAYVKHIQQETGSRVQLKGRGSGFYESSTGVESDEPLHVHISCIREEGLDAAVKLTQDLIDTVKAEAERAPQYGYNRGGYNNVGNRGGYNGYANYNYSSPGSSASPATSAPADGYNYDYNQQYYDYYGQQQQQQYQYDPNSYYNYYDYSAVPVTSAPGATAAAPPLPPPPTSSPPPPPPPASSAALPPPPPPPTWSSPLPPPPPPPSE